MNLVIALSESRARKDQAEQLLRQACLPEQQAGQLLVLHSDNGSAMKGTTMLAAGSAR